VCASWPQLLRLLCTYATQVCVVIASSFLDNSVNCVHRSPLTLTVATTIDAHAHRLTQDALRSFLSKEVLEKYSFLFKQKHENSAPDGSNLEPWLQALLGQMQTSIEQHVNSAMDGSSM
jgi:hypothetical protein